MRKWPTKLAKFKIGNKKIAQEEKRTGNASVKVIVVGETWVVCDLDSADVDGIFI